MFEEEEFEEDEYSSDINQIIDELNHEYITDCIRGLIGYL